MHGHQTSRRRLAFSATLLCLTGCGIGEVLRLVIADAFGWLSRGRGHALMHEYH